MAAKGRMSVSIRMALVDKLREIVRQEPSPVARLFDAERASRATITDSALEVASWCCSGGFGKDLIDKWMPEFQQRLLEVHEAAFLMGVREAARFLGSEVEIDTERCTITIHPPETTITDAGEIDARPMQVPKIPTIFH